jgi:ferrous iron transport protein A
MEKMLNKLKPGERGTVKKIIGSGRLYGRLLDMGITKGAKIEVIKAAPFGGPIDIKVKGYHLSLRREEAEQIILEEK